jgi:hypothetical protein
VPSRIGEARSHVSIVALSAEIVDIVVIYLGGESRLRGVNRNQKGSQPHRQKHRARLPPPERTFASRESGNGEQAWL